MMIKNISEQALGQRQEPVQVAKVHSFFTSPEGILAVFSILAGIVISILWSVPLGLLSTTVGLTVSFVIFVFANRSLQTTRAPLRSDAVVIPEYAIKVRSLLFTGDYDEIFYDTKAYIEKHYAVETEDLIERTSLKNGLPSVNRPIKYPDMRIYVANKSTLRMTQDLVERGLNPLVMDMANRYQPCAESIKTITQEEVLCRQSNIMHGLQGQKSSFPFPPCAGLLLPGVTFIKADPSERYALLAKPFRADVFALAAYNQRDRPASQDEYSANTTINIENFFRAAMANGNDSIVASALGCGGFGNDPHFMAGIFKKVLDKDEFKYQFKEVAFGIIEDLSKANPEGNYQVFKTVLETHPMKTKG